MLRKIECYLMESNLEKLREMLIRLGIEGMSVLQAKGYGTRSEVKDGVPQFEDRVRVDIVVHEKVVDRVINEIKDLAGHGELGAGKLFVIPVEDAIRLSTREHGKSALF